MEGLALSLEARKLKFHVNVWQTTRKNALRGCRTCSTIIFPHSTNQIIDLWCCDYFSSFNQSNHWFVVLSLSLSLSLPLSFLELPLHCYALPVWNQNEISWCFDRESSLPDACCRSFERTPFLESSWRRDWSCDSWPRKQWGLGPSYRSEVFWQS